jgi:hypothetical protein
MSVLDPSGRAVPTALTVSCPGGAVAGTVALDASPVPADLGTALRSATDGATLVEADPARYALRAGDVAVVVAVADGTVHVTASTGC